MTLGVKPSSGFGLPSAPEAKGGKSEGDKNPGDGIKDSVSEYKRSQTAFLQGNISRYNGEKAQLYAKFDKLKEQEKEFKNKKRVENDPRQARKFGEQERAKYYEANAATNEFFNALSNLGSAYSTAANLGLSVT
jgi:hypothetical protein